jgi:hypothetical protein
VGAWQVLLLDINHQSINQGPPEPHTGKGLTRLGVMIKYGEWGDGGETRKRGEAGAKTKKSSETYYIPPPTL